MNTPVQPLDVRYLFPEMRAELLYVLESLSDEQWHAPTACAGWSVKDVAQHIFADDCGYLSRRRDDDGITFMTNDWDELIRLINDQNEAWVRATRRLSRRLLISFLRSTGEQLHDYLATVDLFADAGIVTWAGNRPAPAWLQIARELTEFWMHHQHVCEGAGVTSLKNRRFMHPVLTTFVHALPRTYAATTAPENTTICFAVTGEASDRWYIVRENDTWSLYAGTDLTPAATVTMSDDTAWRMFTKGITPAELEEQTHINGDITLGTVLLNTVAILA